MRIAFKNPNEGIFFYWPWPASSENTGGITVRTINGKELAAIMDACTTKTEEVNDGKIAERTEVDREMRDNLIWDYCIVDWTDLYDEDGAEIKCTQANKRKLMREHPVFPEFVNECIAVAGSRAALRADAELKNYFRS